MPITPGTDPQAAMGQGPPQLGDMGAPQGAGMLAAPSAGLPPMAQGTQQTAMALAQIAAKLQDKIKGIQYGQSLFKNVATILTKYIASTTLDDNPAKHDAMDAIKKLEAAGLKLTQNGPSQNPALSTSLADIVKQGGNSGATA